MTMADIIPLRPYPPQFSLTPFLEHYADCERCEGVLRICEEGHELWRQAIAVLPPEQAIAVSWAMNWRLSRQDLSPSPGPPRWAAPSKEHEP